MTHWPAHSAGEVAGAGAAAVTRPVMAHASWVMAQSSMTMSMTHAMLSATQI